MSQFEKHFTVVEANALLPELRDLLEAIRAARDRAALSWEGAVPALRVARTNGGGRAAAEYLHHLQDLNQRVRKLIDLGVQLKDVDRGLVDFPAWRKDEEVLLCWHLGEDEVKYWHTLEGGYAGREEL